MLNQDLVKLYINHSIGDERLLNKKLELLVNVDTKRNY